MAKLTARFDIQDRISKKLRAIRGEIDSLQKARDRVNKPITMSMRVKDMATKILKRTQMFVLKDLAKSHVISLKAKDGATKTLTAVSNFMKRRMPRTHAVFVSAKDKASPVLQKVGGFIKKNIARTQIMTIKATDRAMPIIRRVGSLARSTLSKGYNFTVRGVDMASRIIGRVSSYAMTAIPRVQTFTIRAINAAGSVIGSIKRALFSIPTLITVTLAAVGIGKLKDSTVGAAMTFEGYEVAMDHWLKGNKKASENLITWMGQLADKTPFSSPDLFPALTRGIGLSGGDINMAKKMLTISADMAALTPGTTVIDAMEALGDAQMGEFERMKGFNMKVSKKDYQAMGGWTGFLNEVEKSFGGGSEKLSQTAQGILSTLQGYKSSILRSLGSGFLEPMKPRLSAISAWLDNNQDKWQLWKSTVKKVGTDASEWVFSKLEKGFSHIQSNYLENDAFKKLDFEGKIKFISEDIGQWWSSKGKPALNNWWESSGKPWAEKVGLFMGESIFNGIVQGVKEGGKALGGMWKDSFKDPSLGSLGGAGIATLITAALSSLVLSPLIKGISFIGKLAQGGWGLGKKVSGFFKNKSSKNNKSPNIPKQTAPNYTMPWTNRGEKPVLKVPNTKEKGFKLPKGLSNSFTGIGKFAKRVPLIGTALGALSILTAKKEDKAKAVGAVGGGFGGAAAGAAIGTAILPGVGTTVGGVLGGIGGSIAGGKAGDWLKDNWSAIKDGASSTGEWITEKFNSASNWVKDTWNTNTAWFAETVWNPLVEGFNTALDFIVGLYDIAEEGILIAWSGISAWFSENVWTPLSTTAGAALDWVGEKFNLAWFAVTTIWGLAWSWFEETVWTPIKTGVELVGSWIAEKFNLGWSLITGIWGLASSWFEETIWTPIKTAAETIGTWIGEKFSDGWNVVTGIWGAASSYFESNIWGPIKTGAAAVESAITTPFKNAWEVVSGIFTKLGNTWDTIKDWGGKASEIGSKTINYVVERGKNRRGQKEPGYAMGTSFHPGGPAILGDGGGPELYRYPNGEMGLSPATDTLMNLPRGTEVLSHRKTVKFFNSTPTYADGIGFNDVPEADLSEGQVAAATRSSGGTTKTGKSSFRDLIIQITGDNHYTDDMDAEKVGKIAYEFILKALELEQFEGGEMVINE